MRSTAATIACLAAALGSVQARRAAAQDITWVKRQPADRPVDHNAAAMAYDSARSVCVFFNDQRIDSQRPTWVWDGADWTVAHLGKVPHSNKYHRMAFDSRRGISVLFGGFYQTEVLDEVWEWNGSGWTARKEQPRPPPTAWGAMAFDSARGVTVVYTADAVAANGQTWEWDGVTWTLRDTDGLPPRDYPMMAYDDRRQVCVLYGGLGLLGYYFTDTWEWDGQAWTQRAVDGPPPRIEAAMTFDSSRGSCILFGGLYQAEYMGDTWEWDGWNWTPLQPVKSPSPRMSPAMAYDSARLVTVLFGGGGEAGPGKDTWELHLPRICPSDCDRDGVLNLFDFLCFSNFFAAGDPRTDCTGDGALDLFDFLCFANGFNQECE